MRRITLFGLCLLVVLALGAAMAVTASQAAEFGRCVAKAGGEYKNSGCTKRSAEAEGGSYEWEAREPDSPPVEGLVGESVFTNQGGTVACKYGEQFSSFTGAGHGETTIYFGGCGLAGHKCQSVTGKGLGEELSFTEEIETFPFETELIDHGEKGPAGLEPKAGEVWFSAEAAPWFSQFECAGLAYFETDGTVSGPITPVNAMASEHKYHVGLGVGEQGLKTTVCEDPSFSKCPETNLPTSESLEGTLHGEWEIRANFVQPPSVKAGAVSEITTSSAVLNASVDPNGQTVSSCKFEYGPTASYGSSAECSPAPGAGASAVKVSAALKALAEGTAYHYRIIATNAGGTSFTADQSFATFLNSKSATNKKESEPAKAEDGPVSATASKGLGTVTVGQYGENPGGVRLIGGAGEYVDVYVSTSSTFTKVEYKDCELGGASTLEWFNPEANEGRGEWQVVTKQTYVAGSPPCIDAVAETSGTSPTVAQMKGTRFKGAASLGAPEFGRCVAAPLNGLGKPEGFFSKSSCTIKDEGVAGEPIGKDEWEVDVLEQRQGQPATKFTLAASSAKLETAVKAFKVTCTGVAGEGEYTGRTALGAIVLKLMGCTQDKEPCTSSGASAGEIKSKTLEGELVWEAQPTKVDLELYPKSGTSFAEFSCAGVAISVRGSVLAPLKVNKMSATPALKFKGSKGLQKPESFEGGPSILEESSDGGSYEAMDLSASITQTNADGTQAEVNTAF